MPRFPLALWERIRVAYNERDAKGLCTYDLKQLAAHFDVSESAIKLHVRQDGPGRWEPRIRGGWRRVPPAERAERWRVAIAAARAEAKERGDGCAPVRGICVRAGLELTGRSAAASILACWLKPRPKVKEVLDDLRARAKVKPVPSAGGRPKTKQFGDCARCTVHWWRLGTAPLRRCPRCGGAIVAPVAGRGWPIKEAHSGGARKLEPGERQARWTLAVAAARAVAKRYAGCAPTDQVMLELGLGTPGRNGRATKNLATWLDPYRKAGEVMRALRADAGVKPWHPSLAAKRNGTVRRLQFAPQPARPEPIDTDDPDAMSEDLEPEPPARDDDAVDLSGIAVPAKGHIHYAPCGHIAQVGYGPGRVSAEPCRACLKKVGELGRVEISVGGMVIVGAPPGERRRAGYHAAGMRNARQRARDAENELMKAIVA